MVKKLVPHGDGLALVLDGPILDLLKIDGDTPIEISADGGRLVLTPQNGQAREEELKSVLKKINDKYGPALKRLAD